MYWLQIKSEKIKDNIFLSSISFLKLTLYILLLIFWFDVTLIKLVDRHRVGVIRYLVHQKYKSYWLNYSLIVSPSSLIGIRHQTSYWFRDISPYSLIQYQLNLGRVFECPQ